MHDFDTIFLAAKYKHSDTFFLWKEEQNSSLLELERYKQRNTLTLSSISESIVSECWNFLDDTWESVFI